MRIPDENPCGCEEDDCENCEAYWTAYGIAEDEYKDRRLGLDG